MRRQEGEHRWCRQQVGAALTEAGRVLAASPGRLSTDRKQMQRQAEPFPQLTAQPIIMTFPF